MDGFVLGVQYYNDKNGTDIEVRGWDQHAHEGLFVGGFCCATERRTIKEQVLGAAPDIILPVAGTDPGSSVSPLRSFMATHSSSAWI
jgi:basic membrane protein A and related proteins